LTNKLAIAFKTEVVAS